MGAMGGPAPDCGRYHFAIPATGPPAIFCTAFGEGHCARSLEAGGAGEIHNDRTPPAAHRAPTTEKTLCGARGSSSCAARQRASESRRGRDGLNGKLKPHPGPMLQERQRNCSRPQRENRPKSLVATKVPIAWLVRPPSTFTPWKEGTGTGTVLLYLAGGSNRNGYGAPSDRGCNGRTEIPRIGRTNNRLRRCGR